MSDNVNTVVLPPGFQVRAPTMLDLPAVFDLLTAWDLAYLETPDTILEDLREQWEDLDLAHDAFLVLAPDGRSAGVATVEGKAKMNAHVAVHPSYSQLGIEAYFRHVTEKRAYERAQEMPGHERISLETWISSRQEVDSHVLLSLGYDITERYHRMRIDMEAPPREPEWPEGITIRTAVAGEDERAVYDVLEDANRENPQHEDDYPGWYRFMVDTHRYDPLLWWLAIEGDLIVGVALGVQDPDEGWVRRVGVRPDWRQRGIATALLQTAFTAFWRRGYARVELGVDPHGVYGAQRLYERAGMRVAFELVKYQKDLRSPY